MDIEVAEKKILSIIENVFERNKWRCDIEESLHNYKFKTKYGSNSDEQIYLNEDSTMLLLLNWIDAVVYSYVEMNYKISPILMKIEDLITNHKTDNGLEMEKLRHELSVEFQPLYPSEEVWIPKNYPYKTLFILNKYNQDVEFYWLLEVFGMCGVIKSKKEEILENYNTLNNFL